MGSLAQMLIDMAVGENTRAERRGFASRLIMNHLPLSQIVAYSLLDQDTVEELALDLGVVLPDTDLRRLVRNSTSQTRAEAGGR